MDNAKVWFVHSVPGLGSGYVGAISYSTRGIEISQELADTSVVDYFIPFSNILVVRTSY